MGTVLYLHGFCSSAGSAKGTYLADRFASEGVKVVRPDLDGGDFRHTTMSGQLALVDRLVTALRPALLIGSSLGGYLAALHASRRPQSCPALVLLAPAFDFHRRLISVLGPQVPMWRDAGTLDFFHYRYGEPMALGHAFLEDAAVHEAIPEVEVCTRVLHGLHDETVSPRVIRRFAQRCPHVSVEWLDTDHGMLDATDQIWLSVDEAYRAARRRTD